MLVSLSSHIPAVLRSPRTFAILGLGIAAAASVHWYRSTRQYPTEEEIERERRDYLAAAGRIVDGSITETRGDNDARDAPPTTLIYSYRIAGVSYECAQDVRPLAEHVRHLRIDLPIQVRFDPRNPGDSIVVAETWSGLRLDPDRASAHAERNSVTRSPSAQI